MSKTTAQVTSAEPIVPFMSLRSLHDTHRELLRQRREDQTSDRFWGDVYRFLQRGEAAGAYLDNDEERQTAQTLLDYWVNHLFRVGMEPPEAILIPFDIDTQPHIPDHLCPYVGLDAFGEDSRHLFFGRQQLIEQLIDQCQVSRLVAVTGSSGAGKSSVVFAGLLPQLREAMVKLGTHRILPTILPASAPLTHLAQMLMPPGINAADWMIEHVAKLQQDDTHLLAMLNQQANETAVLLIDQFEELFTLCHDAEERRAFLGNLLQVVRAKEQPHTVIITMRTDYESYLQKYPLFQALFDQGQVRVNPMSAAELREAIEEPAELVGLKFEEGLVETLIREIIGEPAALPLLQFTLLQLWEHREHSQVTWEAYRRLGGVLKALAQTADAVYNTLLPEDQVTARRILLRLVSPSEGLEVTRSRVRRRTLYLSGEAQDRINRVLDKLIQARLVHLTLGLLPQDDQVEVAHEALVRNWPRLVGWLDEARLSLRQRQRLTHQAEEWDRRGREPGALLRGVLLHEALTYDDMNELEQQFVQASQAAQFAEEREKERQHRHDLAQAQALTKEQQQRAKAQAIAAQRLRYFALAMGAFFVVALVSTVLFFNLQAEASQLVASSTRQTLENELVLRQQEEQVNLSQTTAQAQAEMIAADRATATAQATVSLGQIIAQATQENLATATAVAATVEAQRLEAAESAIRATQAAQQTPIPALLTTPLPQPMEALLAQFTLDAQLRVQVRIQDNMPMRYVSGHTFTMGVPPEALEAPADAQPAHDVTLNSFYIDQYEVSVQQFAAFINEMGGYKDSCSGFHCVMTQFETQYTYLLNNFSFYEPRVGFGNYPVTWVSWYGARDYCRWVGGRLATEAEWEYAARSVDGRFYPWGSTPPTSNRAAFNFPSTEASFFTALKPVEALPDGASPFGIYNMAGNVWEWVQDSYDPAYYHTNPGNQPNTNTASDHVLRGGSWVSAPAQLLSYARFHLPPAITLEGRSRLPYWNVGFRCAQDVTS